MAKNTDDTFELSDNQSQEMAQHFLDFQAEYRTEPKHHEVVYEDEDCIVVADHTGHELSEWADDFDVDRSSLSQWMHEQARAKCDYSWSVSDPVVFPKFVDRRDEYAGQECIHCGAVSEPENDVVVRVERNEHGEHYTVCNICEEE